eukprot:COSAG01_NODE_1447_length_10278_cov_47.625209_3_plen_198_part_00
MWRLFLSRNVLVPAAAVAGHWVLRPCLRCLRGGFFGACCRRHRIRPVSRSCACIGSPCLRCCGHGASIGRPWGGLPWRRARHLLHIERLGLGLGLGLWRAGERRHRGSWRRWRCRGGGAWRGGGGGESFLRVHWVAVPEALRARRVNRCGCRRGCAAARHGRGAHLRPHRRHCRCCSTAARTGRALFTRRSSAFLTA